MYKRIQVVLKKRYINSKNLWFKNIEIMLHKEIFMDKDVIDISGKKTFYFRIFEIQPTRFQKYFNYSTIICVFVFSFLDLFDKDTTFSLKNL